MSHSRRIFLKNTAQLVALASTTPLTDLSSAAIFEAKKPPLKMTNGIQIGADSFADEGTEKVLDILEEKGAINTLISAPLPMTGVLLAGQGRGRTIPAFREEKEGYRKLNQYVQEALNNQRPSDGHYVGFERLLLNYPEIMAYNQLFDW